MSTTGISKYAPMFNLTTQKYKMRFLTFKWKKSRPISRGVSPTCTILRERIQPAISLDIEGLNMQWNPMVPELLVSDFEKSLGFYVEIIGFSIMFQRTDPNFAYLEIGGAQLMIEEDHQSAWRVAEIESPRGRGINLQIDVPSVNEVNSRVEKSGFLVFRPVHESWYSTSEGEIGQLELLVQDPDGYLLRLVSDIA
jgi:catechol 2,3-dioxygenase-like lactoylglutathione lyase family enzyme